MCSRVRAPSSGMRRAASCWWSPTIATPGSCRAGPSSRTPGESPRQAARRETAEEIGLDVELGALLTVDWVRGEGRPPLVSYLFDGGVLDADRLAAVRLQEEELLSWRLVHFDEAQTLVSAQMALRLGVALKVLAEGGGPAELEDGVPPAGASGASA